MSSLFIMMLERRVSASLAAVLSRAVGESGRGSVLLVLFELISGSGFIVAVDSSEELVRCRKVYSFPGEF